MIFPPHSLPAFILLSNRCLKVPRALSPSTTPPILISSVEPECPRLIGVLSTCPSRSSPLSLHLFYQDAFNKLREQIIICHKQPREHRGGLNMINNTNLEFFNSKQKAELFRLKGVFLTSLGAKQEANNAYSHAVQVRPSCLSQQLLLPFRCYCCSATLVSCFRLFWGNFDE